MENNKKISAVNFNDITLLGRLIPYLLPYKFFLFFALLFLLSSTIIQALVPFYIGSISQEIINSYTLPISEKKELLEKIVYQCLILFFIYFLGYLFESFNRILTNWIGQKSFNVLRIQVHRHILQKPMTFFDNQSIGSLMTYAIYDVNRIIFFFTESLTLVLSTLLLYVTITCFIFFMSWKIGLLVLALLIPLGYFIFFFNQQQRKNFEKIHTAITHMNAFIQEQLMGASTIRYFRLKKLNAKKFESIDKEQLQAKKKIITNGSFVLSSIDFFRNTALILGLIVIVFFIPTNQVSLFITLNIYIFLFFSSVMDLSEKFNTLRSALANAKRVFDLLDIEEEETTGKKVLENIESIVFENVWFAYVESNWVLKGLSFSQKKGETLALIGMTGEGKSTVISLLLRFYDIQKGSIQINGFDIRSYTLASLRKQFGLVLQDPVIFSGTLSQNISLFDPHISSQKITEVFQQLGIQDKFHHFESDYLIKEHGKSLSAGEKQLISLARAIAHDCSMIMLDEATANIDPHTESIIQQVLKKILPYSTALIVAHRLSTIKDASRILVIENGKVVEEGSHQTLLAAKGVYEKLYYLQFSK